MYARSARFYDALYHFKDYATASEQLHAMIQDLRPGAGSLLDVACGTGKHLEWLRAHYDVAGLDLSADMLEVARSRCPDVPLHQADMVDFELHRTFDVVTCLFSSIGSVKTLPNLQRAVACMARHLRPQGVMIVEPWFSPDNYWTGRITANFVDQPDLKIAWMYTSEVEGRVSIMDVHYLVGTPARVDHFTERREVGLFTTEEYLDAFRMAGLGARHLSQGLFGRGVYVATKNGT
ncbi:MAG TPA: class I SAM-dependent methyltransferase [Methylomirabilota bacterium]|jgi:ubiquinone/menaquinone biosynthesis C-methylase UbiE